jgi:hypothetical protein
MDDARKESVMKEETAPNWPPRLRKVLGMLSRISCWSTVVWLVWNRILPDYFNIDSVGPLFSIVMGSFLYAMSLIFSDPEPS